MKAEIVLQIFSIGIGPNRSIMNRHQFEQHARHFRSGRISLNQLVEMVFANGKEIAVLEGVPKQTPQAPQVGTEFAVPHLKPRSSDSHKGNFGKVLFVGGSQSMPGAISLAAMSAVRSGAGLVTVATPKSAAGVVASFDPCYMTLACPESGGHFSLGTRNEIADSIEGCDVLAVGPGMGRKVDRMVMESLVQTSKPLVIDADGLFLIGHHAMPIKERTSPTILTPHEGEFSRLVGGSFKSRSDIEAAAIDFAKDKSVTMVLKGPGTLVTDGQRVYRNSTGNPGMATGGSGDVLTGIIAALLGQRYDPLDAAALGVYLHGVAGDIAADSLGELSMTATDIIDSLPDAFKSHTTALDDEFRIGF